MDQVERIERLELTISLLASLVIPGALSDFMPIEIDAVMLALARNLAEMKECLVE